MNGFDKDHQPWRRIRRVVATGALIVTLGFAPAPWSTAQGQGQPLYTVNGQIVSLEVQQMMMALGLTPGHYYVDQYGNLGVQGQPPMINLDGGPPRTTGPLFGQGVVPAQPAPGTASPGFTPGAPQVEQQFAGVRLFWVFSSRLGYGGSSGFFHLCPNNVFHRSAEGSFRVGGEYDSSEGRLDPSVGAASVVQETGNWRVEQGQSGPMVILFGQEPGVTWEFRVADIQSGRWRQGDFDYVSEVGQASCR